MKHLTVGIFGTPETSEDVIKQLGKKGTANDIELYNHGSSDGVFTYMRHNSEKIQPFLQILGMIDIPVIVVKELTKELGEIIIAVDAKAFEKGIIATNNPDGIKDFIKGTSLEKFEIIADDVNEIRQKLISTEFTRNNDIDPVFMIDNSFDVKSIGTVVLGVLKQGKLKKYDKLMLEPMEKEILVKSMQSQDRDIENAESGMRLGIALKGADADEIKRGSLICKHAKKSNEFTIELERSKYNREDLKEKVNVFLSIGAHVSTASIESVDGNKFKLRTMHQMAYTSPECIVASTMANMPRIIGKGKIL